MDTIHGDDSLAATQNLPVSSYLNVHPAPSPALKPKGELVYAPAPFRTVTAAINWINANFNNGRLPWQNPATGKIVDFIVIRCNPGLYGPTDQPGTEIDPLSGMPWNGETFPIKLPDRVSIQGASALNTIFDARRYHSYPSGTSIFAIDNTRYHDETFVRVFIDGITIRGARGEPIGTPSNQIPPGAGVMIDDYGANEQIEMTVSNCFIYDNDVGIAVSSPYSGVTHWPRIINDTFAWNGIGLWNGGNCRTNATQKASHWTMVINCIFDQRSPNLDRAQIAGQNSYFNGAVSGVSGFEGLSVYELTVLSLNGATKNQDYNAYEKNKVNLQPNYPGWPNVTQNVNGTPPALNPRVDLGPYIQPLSGSKKQRFCLYINDIFWWYNHKFPGVFLPNFDLSPHDFRLSPNVSTDGGATWTINPLIEKGITLQKDSNGNFSLVMGYNGVSRGTINELPGIPSGYVPNPINGDKIPPKYGEKGSYSDVATYYCNDWDGEGWGNKRNYDHPLIPPNLPNNDITDIGADEVGTLIMAGYLEGTTIFTRTPNERVQGSGIATNLVDNTQVFFFGLSNRTNNPRPRYNEAWSRSYCTRLGNFNQQPYDWWRFVWRPLLPPPYQFAPWPMGFIGNYGNGEVLTPGAWPTESFRYYLIRRYGSSRNLYPFPANLRSDFANNPNMDFSGLWALPYDPMEVRFHGMAKTNFRYDPHNQVYKPPFQDAFSANAWYKNPANDTQAPSPYNDQLDAGFGTDNEFLFHYRDSSGNLYCATTSGNNFPPGTMEYQTTWLLLSIYSIPNFDPTGSGSTIYNLNVWGFGDTQVQDLIPFTTDPNYNNPPNTYAMGWRVNCEVGPNLNPGGAKSNLQTFLGVNWEMPVNKNKVNASAPSAKDNLKKILGSSAAYKRVDPIVEIRKSRK